MDSQSRQKDQMTQDLSFAIINNANSINNRVNMDAYPNKMVYYGWCLPCICHFIVALRQCHPDKRILIAKYDYSDAFQCMAHDVDAAMLPRANPHLQIIRCMHQNLNLVGPKGRFGGPSKKPVLAGTVKATGHLVVAFWRYHQPIPLHNQNGANFHPRLAEMFSGHTNVDPPPSLQSCYDICFNLPMQAKLQQWTLSLTSQQQNLLLLDSFG
jgi:hypothetical protein